MIDFTGFKIEKGTALYLQIVSHIKRGIAAGTILDGDELPSRRMLSALLGINPNTVQKAFSLLEEEGLILSKTGAVSIITIGSRQISKIRKQLLSDEIEKMIITLKAAGLELEDAKALLEKMWEDWK